MFGAGSAEPNPYVPPVQAPMPSDCTERRQSILSRPARHGFRVHTQELCHLARPEHVVIARRRLNRRELGVMARGGDAALRSRRSRAFLLAHLSQLGSEEPANLSELIGRELALVPIAPAHPDETVDWALAGLEESFGSQAGTP
jgi:hypothetical protein